jgi:type III secretion protein T
MDTQFSIVVLPFLLSLPRVAAVFTVLPLFGKRTVQGLIRNEFILIMALFVYPLAAPGEGISVPGGMQYVAIALKETAIGVTFGFFLGTFFWVAENVGYLIDLQTGTHNLQVFDPLSDHEEGPTAGFMLQFVITLLLAGGGLLTILDLLFDSYRVWPIFDLTPRFNEAFADTVSARADTLFSMTVRFAAPIVILLLLIELGLGLINRFSEHIDVYSLAMPIKSLVAFFVLLVFLSFVYDSLLVFLSRDNDALRLLEEALR